MKSWNCAGQSRRILVALCSWALLVFSPALLAMDLEQLEEEHRLSLEFETPHTDWAQPYARGRIRALFFSSGRDANAREIVELMQRFDIDADAVYWSVIVDTPDWGWHGRDLGRQRILHLLENKYDVFIFNGIALSKLSAEAQYKVLRPVTEGAGLVLTGFTDKRVLKPNRRIQPLPRFLENGPAWKAYKVKKGRGIQVPSRPNIAYRAGWEVEYDYWSERLGRAVLWAAGREPDVNISIQLQAKKFERKKLPGGLARISVRSDRPAQNPGYEARLTYRQRFRSSTGQVVPLEDGKLQAPGGMSYEVTGPKLAAGQWRLEVWARGKQGVESWNTAPFEVVSESFVSSIELKKDWGEIGQSIEGTVQLGGPVNPAQRLEVRLLDRRGRILARTVQGPGRASLAFRFPVQDWLPMLVRVQGLLKDGAGEISSTYRDFHVTKRHRGRFNFLVWDYSHLPGLRAYAEEALSHLGTTLQLGHGNPPVELAAYDIAWVPYTTRIMAPHNKNGTMKPACWNDVPSIEKHIQSIGENYVPSRQHGVFVWSLGDETVTRGACVHPACMKAYRLYLQKQYRSINALNRSWSVKLASFDQVGLSREGDSDEHTALQNKNYPRWYDRQAFQCSNFVGLCQKFARTYKGMDPRAKTGFEGAGRFDRGDDYDLIVNSNGFWSPYPGLGDEVIRSIAPREFPRANWMGYRRDANPLLAKYWRMVTRGMDAVWWWRWDNIGRFHGLLAPDLAPYDAIKTLMEDTRIVRQGLGDLLIHSQMLDNGIAMLYSHPSAYAVRLEKGPTFAGYQTCHEAWIRAIREQGLQFRYVTDRMLHQEDALKSFKVLVLPRSEAIGPQEAATIRKFVERGGTVLADVRPGLFDHHCKPLGRGALDDLFGIEQTGQAGKQSSPATFSKDLEGHTRPLTIKMLDINPAVRLAGGTALGQAGDTPVAINRRAGKGQAILLNFNMPSWPSPALKDTDERAANFVRSLFVPPGQAPSIRVQSPNGQRVRNLETVRWQDGDISLVALYRPKGEQEKARLLLPKARHVYNLRTGKYLGKRSRFKIEILPYRATFFALLPWKAGPLEVHASLIPEGKSRVLRVRLSVPKAGGLHPVHLQLADPSGARPDWGKRNILTGGQEKTVDLPIAFNDAAGTWKLETTDVLTGRRKELKIQVPGD